MTATQLREVTKRRGFRVPRRTALVEFASDHDYYGAEIELNLSVSIATSLQADALMRQMQTGEGTDSAALEFLDLFADSLLAGWNLEDDDGNPLPANSEGLRSLPFDFITALFLRWREVATGVTAPLEEQADSTDWANLPAPRDLGL